ncbi:hypothetical protein [Microcoleus sp. OTE_8_concoct_300]
MANIALGFWAGAPSAGAVGAVARAIEILQEFCKEAIFTLLL